MNASSSANALFAVGLPIIEFLASLRAEMVRAVTVMFGEEDGVGRESVGCQETQRSCAYTEAP